MQNPRDIKVILFDIGNVLVKYDSHKLCNNLLQFCDHFYVKQKDIYDYLYNFRSFIKLELGEIDIDDLYIDIKKRFNMDVDIYDFCKTWTKELTANPDMKRMTSLLSENYTLGILSNIDTVRYRYIIEQKMIDISKFKNIYLSYSMHMVKPDIRIADYIAEDSSKESVLFIDDKEINVRSMEAGGIRSIKFDNPTKLKNDLREMGVDPWA